MRLVAALLAPLVALLALAGWLPTHGGDLLQPVADLGSAADRADQAPTAYAAPPATSSRRGAPGLTAPETTSRTASRNASRAHPARVEVEQPLTVTMDSLTPGVVPKRGPVVVRGRITNNSAERWEGLNIYACTSRQPLTSAEALAGAVLVPRETVVCGRTTVFKTIQRLAPGASRGYQLRIPRDKLAIGTQPGVYWFSVQVLGTSSAGRDTVVDGDVRTFLPLVDSAPVKAPVTVVLPLRRSTQHTADGRLVDGDELAKEFAPGGRLGNILELAEDAPAESLALLVDPAVVDAARQVAGGNLPRSLGPTDTPPDATVDVVGRTAAAAWIERFTALARDQRLLALPYGDLDVAAAATSDPELITRALEESAAYFDALELSSDPVIAPPDGVLPTEALDALQGSTVLLSRAALSTELPAELAVSTSDEVTSDGYAVRLYDAELAEGGPATSNRLQALSLRQRVLAEAAVRATEGDDRPLLVVAPAAMDPGPSAQAFFTELQRGFTDLGTSTAAKIEESPEVGDLAYTNRQAARQIPASTLDTADRLIDLGGTLDRLLPGIDTLERVALHEALSSTSYLARTPRGVSTSSPSAAVAWFEDRLADVDVSVPRFVILSSDSGPFAMTITNNLDQPIRVGIRADTTGGLVISAPPAIDVPAKASHTVNLSAKASQVGVHSVVLVATDETGRRIQESQEISIRINQVGRAIWVIMGGGLALLVVMIGIRLRLRIRRARSAARAAAARAAAAQETAQ